MYNIQAIIDLDLVVLGGGISNRISLVEEFLIRLDSVLRKLDIMSIIPQTINSHFKNAENLIGAMINYKNVNKCFESA